MSGELKKLEEKTFKEEKEVIDALLSLGFKRTEIKEALNNFHQILAAQKIK